MTEPTPGPWIRDPANPQNIIGNGPSWRSVALVRSDADARLIAKARHLPELVEALQGHENPQLWRIEWLATLLDEIEAGRFGWIVDNYGMSPDEDPSATAEMIANIREFVQLSRAALALVQETADG